MSPATTRPFAWARRVALRVVRAGPCRAALAPAAPPAGKEGEKKEAEKPADPSAVEARFADGSSLKITLKEEKVELVTPYGKLSIPVADIRRIDFATRL